LTSDFGCPSDEVRKKLLIGHFSSKYDTLEEFETEAREVFPNTELAVEGAVYMVDHLPKADR